MLRVEGLRVAYGGVVAVRGVSFTLEPGALAALVGPNGAGKTSALAAVAGLVPHGGTVALGARDLTGLRADARARAGLALVTDARRLFPKLTVEQNLLVGAVRLERRAVRAAVDGVLERFPILAERRAQRAGTLSGGEGQVLAIARALVASPAVLLVDEPFQGLAEGWRVTVTEVLREAAAAGAAVLVGTPKGLDGARAIAMRAGEAAA